MFSRLRLKVALTLCALATAVTAHAQELLPAVSFRSIAGVQGAMHPADFNGDGIVDFAALGASNALQVWIGNGDGSFRPPAASTVYVSPAGTGDINGDGRTDVVGTFVWAETGRTDLVAVPGRGDGTFGAPVAIAPSGGPDFALLADLDNDSHLDLVTGYGGETYDVTLHPGNGDFTFDPVVSVTTGGEGPRAAVIADVDNDGRRDVVVAHEVLGVYVLENNGGFIFTSTPVPSGSGRSTGVKASDVNGDGHIDLLISGRGGPTFYPPWTNGYVFVALGNGAGGFSAGGEYPSGRGANSIVFGDFTHDGVVDAATLNHSYSIPSDRNFCYVEPYISGNSVSVLEGGANGTFGLPTTFAVEPQRGDRAGTYGPFRLGVLSVGDVNRDQFPDLLVGDGTILLPVAPRANRAPTALAGADYRTGIFELLLDGTGTDPDGHFLEFHWSGGTGGVLLNGSQPLACYDETTTFGQQQFTLTVSDGHGGIDSDDVAIYRVRPPSVTILSPRPGEAVPAGQPYTIRWSVASEDPITAVQVYGGSGGVPLAMEGCTNLPASATQCTWITPATPSADAEFSVEVSNALLQSGFESSGRFLIRADGAVPAGWQNRDVGAVGAPGSASFNGGVFSISGSGADIWGTADELHYAYITVSRDFEIIARVASIQNVNAWTKAGLMIREGTGAGARHASLFMTPTEVKGVAFQRRPTPGGTSVHTSGRAVTAPGWLRLVREGNTVTAFYRRFPTLEWERIGAQTFTALADTLLVGLAVSSHVDARPALATFDSVTVARDHFVSADIGAVRQPGTTEVGSAGVTIEGAGPDIWGTSDAFRYYYRSWTGDGTITVRVASVENTSAWAKAGVMFRETLAAHSKHVMAVATPGKGVAVQYRGTSGGASANAALAPGTAPGWLRLTRSGHVFTASASEDGTTWQTLSSLTIPMTSSVYVGLPVTSHNNLALATAVFDHPIVEP